MRARGDASGAGAERVGAAGGGVDAATAWRCEAVISCARRRWCGASTDGVAALGDERFTRYSSESCISRTRAATAVLTPDSSPPRAVPCSDEDGARVRGLGAGAKGDGREGGSKCWRACCCCEVRVRPSMRRRTVRSGRVSDEDGGCLRCTGVLESPDRLIALPLC